MHWQPRCIEGVRLPEVVVVGDGRRGRRGGEGKERGHARARCNAIVELCAHWCMQCVHTQVCVQHFCVCAHHSCVHTHYQLLIYEENAVIFLIPHSNPSKSLNFYMNVPGIEIKI